MSWLRAGSLAGMWWFFEPVFLKCGGFVDGNRFLELFEKPKPTPQKHESRAVRGFEYGGPSRTRTYDQGIMSHKISGIELPRET